MAGRTIEDGTEFMPSMHLVSVEELRIVLRNILDNAARVNPIDSPIEVILRPYGEVVELTVRDFGPGLPEAERTDVFERFYRSNDANDGRSGGAGIGLAVVKRIVDGLGGSARFVDIEPGAMIKITLPIPARVI
jgi:signal transduction histidine kinase